MINLPTIVSQQTLEDLGERITAACKNGDSVNAIAERAGVRREMVSRLKNANYSYSPSFEVVEKIANAIGLQITFTKTK